MKKILYLFLAVLFFLSSCSVKKRSYRNGYYVDWVFHKEKIKKHENKSVASKNKTSALPANAVETIVTPNLSVEASAGSVIDNKVFLPTKPSSIKMENECGDLIFFRNGDSLKVKILLVTNSEIEYKPCDKQDGPVETAERKEVARIKYLNGTIEDFVKMERSEKYDASGKKKKVPPLARLVLALTIGIIVFNVLAALAVILIVPKAEKQILKDTEKYRGIRLLDICRNLSGAFLVLVAAAIGLFALYTLIIFLV